MPVNGELASVVQGKSYAARENATIEWRFVWRYTLAVLAVQMAIHGSRAFASDRFQARRLDAACMQ